jgi:hypothetical protein
MIDDPTRTKELALLTTAKVAAVSDIVAPTNEYISALGDAGLRITEGTVITIGDAIFNTAGTTLSVAHLDTGASFQQGRDYYVYICDNGSDNEVYKISLNGTFPTSFNADTSRKIGGFHFGQCRRHNANMQPINAAGVERGAGWEGNVYAGIIPRSVWTLKHRPKCAPEGMVYLGSGTWIDIYLSSGNGSGGLRSAFNELPETGTEGNHWFTMNEKLLAAGKRMPTYAEFCQSALGAPQGQDNNNTNAWAQATNTARQRTGFVAPAVSSIGCRDTTGNVWEWLDELISRYDASGGAAPGAWAWYNNLGAGQGQAYMNASNQLIALIAGGAWGNGVIAGPRAVSCSHVPWNVRASIGVRGACDAL